MREPLRRRLLTKGAGFRQKDCRLSNIQFPKRTNLAIINSGEQKELPMAEMDREIGVKPRRKRSTRRETALRDVRSLAIGVSLEEVAANEGLSPRRARERVSAMFASRKMDPPAEFVQLQIRRLSEAMIVAYGAMSSGNLKAVDRVVKITREFDRYHGFALSLAALPPALASPAVQPALAPPRIEESINRVASD
jgi:hypothetical protein